MAAEYDELSMSFESVGPIPLIPVPQDEFGPGVETGSAILKHTAVETNSKIVVEENGSGCGAEPFAHISPHTEAGLEKATFASNQFCKERARSSQIAAEKTVYVEVPAARAVQFVHAIPSMKVVTGADIRLAGDWDDEGQPYRLFSITGNPDEVKQAKAICQEAASDERYIPTAEQLAVETVELNPDEENATLAPQPRVLLQPWFNDMQPIPLDFCSAPADHYGPQPDHAHKWLEYYRKVGLIDQAIVIDALMKARALKR
ncbi:unnamed protein product, partial [Mesorhabditis spiculigera]